jgi:hypothetical protein
MKTLGLLIVLGAVAYSLYPDLLTKLAKPMLPAPPAPKAETKQEERSVPDGESGDHLFPADLTS